MARTRNIKPGFFKNEDLAECGMATRLLYAGLWTLADRAGRLEYRPKRIKAELFPYDNIDILELLEQLEQFGFIRRYKVDGHEFLCIPTFSGHQSPHQNEPASSIPEPTLADGTWGVISEYSEPTSTHVPKSSDTCAEVVQEHSECAQALTLNIDSLNMESLNLDSLTPIPLSAKNAVGAAGKADKGGKPADDVGEWYERFWKDYPTRDGAKVGKAAGLRVARKIPGEDLPLVTLALEKYVASGQRPKDAERFLANDYWRDWLGYDPVTASVKSGNGNGNGSGGVRNGNGYEPVSKSKRLDSYEKYFAGGE